MTDKRDNSGKFAKGTSGNKSGRPKTDKLTTKDKKELASIIKDNVKDKTLMSEMLTFMLERASTLTDVHKYFKEYATFLMPKLAQVKQEIVEEKTITIEIKGYGSITADTPKTIEGEVIDEE
jgi:hypothetical protein